MDMTIDRTKFKALANELAKDIKTEADLTMLSRELLKLTVETALNAELTEHLGYEKHGDSKAVRRQCPQRHYFKMHQRSAWRS